MVRPPPRSTLFPTRRSSDLGEAGLVGVVGRDRDLDVDRALRGAVLQVLERDVAVVLGGPDHGDRAVRSEEHTSELQSRLHLVCRLLLEKKNIPSFTT